MSLGIFVMGLIILINLIVIGAVMYYGAQHDPHTNTRSQESSKAVQLLIAQEERRNKRLQELAKNQTVPQSESSDTVKPDAVSSQLGDAEAREKRRQEALARKAARRAQQAPSSET